MKAEAPEKIWVHELSAKELNVPLKECHIEYIRQDAFIENACKFLSNEANIPLFEGYNDTFGCDTSKLVDNFRKHMKGE